MTKELVEIIDKNGVRTRRWKNVSAAGSDHSPLSKVSASSVIPRMTREEQVKFDFISSECWVLAKHLHEQNPERYRIAMLGDEGGGWVHAFVKDTSREDTYIDIEGEHSTDDMLIGWDWNPDWDEIIDGDVSEFDDMRPDKSLSSLDDALAVLKADGIEIEIKEGS